MEDAPDPVSAAGLLVCWQIVSFCGAGAGGRVLGVEACQGLGGRDAVPAAAPAHGAQ